MKSKAKYPGIRLNAAVITDIHIDTRKERAKRLHKGLKDMERAETPNDAMVCVGDITDHGEKEHWEEVEKVFASHKPAKNILLVLGNHDQLTRKEEETDFRELFFTYSRLISGRRLNDLWFSEKINGYSFIVLGDDEDGEGFGDRQMEWFRGQMEEASKDGKPIFVFAHESLNISHGLPYTWERKWSKNRLPEAYRSGIGVRSDEIEAVLRKYKNVFYFSGHIHLGLVEKRRFKKYGFSNIETIGSFHRVNVPCFMFPNHHGVPLTGVGYQLEVYDDKVLLRARRYTSGTWLGHFSEEFNLI